MKPRGATKAIDGQLYQEAAQTACFELFQSLFWDADSLARITSGWVQCTPKKLNTVTSFVHCMVESLAHGRMRFSMDQWGMSFCPEAHLRIRYEYMTQRQRCLVFYISRHRKRLFAHERVTGNDAFWLGKTYLPRNRLEEFVNRAGLILHLTRHLLAYDDGRWRKKLYAAFSRLCVAHKHENVRPVVARIGYALGHYELTLEEFDMVPGCATPDEILAAHRTTKILADAHRRKTPIFGGGSAFSTKTVTTDAAPPPPTTKRTLASPVKRKQVKRKRLDQHSVSVCEWTGEETCLLPAYVAPLPLIQW